MNVREMINELLNYNMIADIKVVAHNQKYDFSLAWGNSEGVTKEKAQSVSFYVDELCDNEQEEK